MTTTNPPTIPTTAPPATKTERLYLVVRADLSPAQQAVQSAHALRAFVAQHQDIDRTWYETSNTLALLEVPDEPALQQLWRQARLKGLATSPFHEPDLDKALTAVAFEPKSRSFLKKLRRALQL